MCIQALRQGDLPKRQGKILKLHKILEKALRLEGGSVGTGFSFMQDITCSKPYTHPSEPVAFFSLGSVQLGLSKF